MMFLWFKIQINSVASFYADFDYHLGTDGGAAYEANGKGSCDCFDLLIIKISWLHCYLFHSLHKYM